MVRRSTILFVALLLVFGGGAVAFYVQTDGGTIETRNIRFAAGDGQMIGATLYVPPGVSSENPAPGVVATHGYINVRETQSPFAIEFARRGFVVLAIDQTGHGYSDPSAFSLGFGGPPALKYMRSLSFVDEDNIGLEGHSMGGWASVAAASSQPNGYEAMVLVGSSTGSFGVAEGNATFPRNVAVVFSEYDQFARLMWEVPHASNIEHSEKLQTLFGTDRTVEEGRTYGSIENGTARRLYTPATTHPGDHLSTAAVGAAIEWLQLTLEGEDSMPASNQTWWLKEIATLLSLLGGLLFLFPFGAAVLEREPFDVRRERPAPAGVTGRGWYLAVALAALVPVLTYYPLNLLGQGFVPLNWAFPQQITNGVMVWALGNAVLILVAFAVWHYWSNRGTDRARYGFDTDGAGTIGRAFLGAVVILGGFYALLMGVGYLFDTGFRFWVFTVRLPSPLQFRIALVYMVPLGLFFLALELLLHGQLRPGERPFPTAFVHNWIAVVGGFVLLLAVQYAILFSGTPQPLGQPLLTIFALQFVAILTIAAAISTYFFRRTGRVWTGAFLNTLLVTITLVAGTATHAPL